MFSMISGNGIETRLNDSITSSLIPVTVDRVADNNQMTISNLFAY